MTLPEQDEVRMTAFPRFALKAVADANGTRRVGRCLMKTVISTKWPTFSLCALNGPFPLKAPPTVLIAASFCAASPRVCSVCPTHGWPGCSARCSSKPKLSFPFGDPVKTLRLPPDPLHPLISPVRVFSFSASSGCRTRQRCGRRAPRDPQGGHSGDL